MFFSVSIVLYTSYDVLIYLFLFSWSWLIVIFIFSRNDHNKTSVEAEVSSVSPASSVASHSG